MKFSKQFDAPIETKLRRRVTAAFIGFTSWRDARLAAQDAYWEAHAYEVMETIQRTSTHVSQAANSAGVFALSGKETSLVRYQTAIDSILRDEQALRHLTTDNPSQQRRLDVLEPQVRMALEFSESIIDKRRKLQSYPSGSDSLEAGGFIDLVQSTANDMRAEEIRLLSQRTQRAEAGQWLTKFTAIAGAFLGAGLWVLAWLAVNREIDGSARTRTQITALNAGLEQRVEQRTADLQSEITERKVAEQALKESLATSKVALRELADQSFALDQHAIVATTNVQGTITHVNEKFCSISKYSKDELIGRNHRILNSGHHPKEFFQRMYETITDGKVWHGEIKNRAKDGSIYWVDTTIVPFAGGDGKPRQYIAIHADLTERKRIEEALVAQAQVMNSGQVFVRDMQNRVVFWPLGAEKLYGFGSGEALGIVSHDLFRTQFPEPLEMIEKKLFATGVWEGELIHRRRDGTTIFVSSAWMLHRDNQGRPVRILETNVDITARKQAHERLATQAEELANSRFAFEAQTLMLQSVLDGMTEGLVAADEQGKFVLWNIAAEKILGMGPDNLAPQEWAGHYGLFLNDTVTPFPTEQLPLARAIRGEANTSEMFVRNHRLVEGAWIEVSAGPRKTKDGVVCGAVAAFRDITRRKADEREIQELNDELEQRVAARTAQLETVNMELEAFSYSVSHDLRAPLRHIGSFSGILMEEFGPTLDPAAQNYLKRIQAGTQKMGVLIDELLNLAQVGRHALNLQPTRLNSIVAEVREMLQPDSVGRQVEWLVDDLPAMVCDPVLVKQVFQNLLTNALKFTRPRARVVIEVSHKEENGQSVFMVRDNGVGFNMQYVNKLFGVFQRLHSTDEFEGTGVGLVTVQRIIHKHGGRVWADAEADKGAAFYFTLGVGKQQESKANQATAGGQS